MRIEVEDYQAEFVKNGRVVLKCDLADIAIEASRLAEASKEHQSPTHMMLDGLATFIESRYGSKLAGEYAVLTSVWLTASKEYQKKTIAALEQR